MTDGIVCHVKILFLDNLTLYEVPNIIQSKPKHNLYYVWNRVSTCYLQKSSVTSLCDYLTCELTEHKQGSVKRKRYGSHIIFKNESL